MADSMAASRCWRYSPNSACMNADSSRGCTGPPSSPSIRSTSSCISNAVAKRWLTQKRGAVNDIVRRILDTPTQHPAVSAAVR